MYAVENDVTAVVSVPPSTSSVSAATADATITLLKGNAHPVHLRIIVFGLLNGHQHELIIIVRRAANEECIGCGAEILPCRALIL